MDLDGGDTGGDCHSDTVSRVTHYGYKAVLDEVMGPGLLAVNACVDMVCVRMIRATTGARPIVGDESQHGRQGTPKNEQNQFCHSPFLKALTPSEVERQDSHAAGVQYSLRNLSPDSGSLSPRWMSLSNLSCLSLSFYFVFLYV